MPITRWKALSEQAKNIWDTMADDDKALILALHEKRKEGPQSDPSKFSVNTHTATLTQDTPSNTIDDVLHWPWSPSIPIGRHDQAAIPEIFAQSFPSRPPRQLRLKFTIMKSLSTATGMRDKSSLMTSNTVFPKPLAERKVLSSIEVPMEASQVLTQGSLNAILTERLIFVASITKRSLPFLLSLLELGAIVSTGGCQSYNAPVRISSTAREVDSFFISIGIFCQ
jgi:hypothetical protein